MKKSLIITDKLYPDESGGSCTYAYETAIELKKYMDIDIFTCYPDKIDNNKYFNCKMYRSFLKKQPFKSVRYLINILKDNQYDVVIFHSVYSWFIYYIAKKITKVRSKQIAIFHGPWHKEAKSKYEANNEKLKSVAFTKIMKKMEEMYVDDNEKFIFLSNYMKSELIAINKNLEKKQSIVIPGGVRVEKYIRNYEKKEAKKKMNLEGKFVIFILRRLEHRMGIQNAIEAISMLKEDIKENVFLVIGGKGTYREQLEKRASELNVNCRFVGFIPDDDINLFFCAADLFLVPSIDLEGFGLVNLESLCMGVPVLATPQGGMKEVETMFDNFYTSKDISPESICNSIEELYSKLLNEEYVKEKNIESYDWSNISNKIYDFIKD